MEYLWFILIIALTPIIIIGSLVFGVFIDFAKNRQEILNKGGNIIYSFRGQASKHKVHDTFEKFKICKNGLCSTKVFLRFIPYNSMIEANSNELENTISIKYQEKNKFGTIEIVEENFTVTYIEGDRGNHIDEMFDFVENEIKQEQLKQEKEEQERKQKQEKEEQERKLKQEKEEQERKLKQEKEEQERKQKQEKEEQERKQKQERINNARLKELTPKSKILINRILNSKFLMCNYNKFCTNFKITIGILEELPINFQLEDLKVMLSDFKKVKNVFLKSVENESEKIEEVLKDVSFVYDYDNFDFSILSKYITKNILDMEDVYIKRYIPGLKYIDEFDEEFLDKYLDSVTIFYTLIMEEYSKKFKNNEELNTIYNNLINTNISKEYIIDKVFDLYRGFYIDVFDRLLEKEEIECILFLIENEQTNNYISYNEIDTLFSINDIKKSLQNLKNSEAKISFAKKQIVANYTKQISLIADDFDINGNLMCIIFRLQNELNCFELFELLDYLNNMKFDIIDNFYKAEESKELEKERTRILNGDLSKELEFQKLELDLNSIQNGFEFEEYVAKLYNKLGYEIEKITKKSKDQRSRCNT